VIRLSGVLKEVDTIEIIGKNDLPIEALPFIRDKSGKDICLSL